jgi:hypothetical protein
MSVKPTTVTSPDGLGKSDGLTLTIRIPGAVVNPVAQAGRQVYESVLGGVQWYLEHWGDVVGGARAEQSAATESASQADVAGILESLPKAKIISAAPGRVRVRVKQLKANDEVAYQTVETLARLPGIRRIELSQVTGSLLILYNPGKYASPDALLEAGARL